MTPSEVRSAPVPIVQANHPGGLLRWVCTNNPFYVLSAGLFFVGLKLSFGTQSEVETWALMSGLAGYTLLLTLAAFLLVRFARVWDDARTVLLLVVLMFLATSVSLDELLVLNPRQGCLFYLAGLLFAVAVSEGLLHGIGLVMPMGFRLPYYLILGLFFLYPLALSPLLDQPRNEGLLWGLFGFSTAAGLAFLTLLPAIRRGPGYVKDSGSPWIWPLYPWTLFGLLAFAVVGRAWLLCWSLHVLVDADNLNQLIFGPYFLAPFGFALAVLLLEIGLVSQQRGVLFVALAAPVGLIVLTMVGHRSDPIYQDFLDVFTTRLGGNPPFIALLLAAAFYSYAMLRHIGAAAEALTGILVALAFVDADAWRLEEIVLPATMPLVAAALLQLGLGVWRHCSWRCLVGAGGLVAFTVLALPEQSEFGAHRGTIAFHLTLLSVLVISAAFDDVFSRLLRSLAAALVLLACAIALAGLGDRFGNGAPWTAEAYTMIMIVVLAGYGLLVGHRFSQAVAGLVLVCWLALAGWRGYFALRQIVVGLDFLAGSLALFALAVLVSLAKAGLLPWRLVFWRVTPSAQRGGDTQKDVAAAYSAQARRSRPLHRTDPDA